MNNYFTIDELTKSQTADIHNIDNTPPKQALYNLEYVISKLNCIREEFGKPIYVNSGYRCSELNGLVGGEKTSYHLKGLAVDITASSIAENKRLFNLIRYNYEFDKLICEKGYLWLHLQYPEEFKKPRNKVLYID